MEYCEGKSNLADRLFRRRDYIDKDNKPMYIVRYVTCLFSKFKTQKVFKESGQTFKKLKVNIKSKHLESLLGAKTLPKPNFDRNFSQDLESELPMLHPPAVKKNFL